MHSDYSLSFLGRLAQQSSDDEIEALWAERTFPLVRTDDFDQNWKKVDDLMGIFVNGAGSRCRVVPQDHYGPQCRAKLMISGTEQDVLIPYEAIVFSKVSFQLFKNQITDRTLPWSVHRRRFIQQRLSKLPGRWRNIILKRDLYLYNEKPDGLYNQPTQGIYNKLNRPENIRLLTLYSVPEEHSVIECSLSEASLESCPKYEALSYVWGKPLPRRSIQMNGTSFSVTENLEAALRQLRNRSGDARMLWVDAVCINQSNNEEKGSQVAQIDLVYRNATAVLVWLGPETNTSSKAFKCMEDFANTFKDPCSPSLLQFPFMMAPYCPHCLNSSAQHALTSADVSIIDAASTPQGATRLMTLVHGPPTPDYIFSRDILDLMESFVNLLQRPWWRRVWVLQEAILGKRLTIHCGTRAVEWSVFQSIFYTLIRQVRRSVAYRTHQQGSVTPRAILSFNLLLLASSTFPFFLLRQGSNYAHQAGWLPLSSLTTLSSDFESTDPRDKLFALLGFTAPGDDGRLALKPDYNTSAPRLYTKATRHFLESSRKLDVITARPRNPQYHPTYGREILQLDGPSWVPDWAMRSSFAYNSIGNGLFSQYHVHNQLMGNYGRPEDTIASNSTIFHAGLYQTSPFSFEFSGFGEILHARGMEVDCITKIGMPLDPIIIGSPVGPPFQFHNDYIPGPRNKDQQSNHDAQLGVIREWATMCRAQQTGMYRFTGQPLLEALWRTVFLDRYIPDSTVAHQILRLPSDMGEENARKIFVAECNFPPIRPEDEDLLISYIGYRTVEDWGFTGFNPHSFNLSFFMTSKGYIGVCHPDVEIGDKVVVLLGGSVPYVLREYPEGHVLIGESYVHGIMDGEAAKSLVDQGKGDKKEDYELFTII